MNAKISALNDQFSKLQARRIQAKKDLISLKNDIASKDELYKMQQKKYDGMKAEIDKRTNQIKELEEEINGYVTLDPKFFSVNSYNAKMEAFLGEANIKKEFLQLLYEENKKVDTKFVIKAASSEEENVGEVPPDQETYAKSMVESITLKFIRKRKEEPKKTGQKIDDDDDSKKMSFMASFRINKDTTFNNLKTVACNFWQTEKQGCDYFLTDEAGSQLPEGCKIEEYFKSQLQDIHNVLLVLRPREPSKNLTPGMIDAISTSDQQGGGQVGQLNFARIKKVEIDGYAEFFDNFPGMKNFINEDKLKEKKKKQVFTNEKPKKRIIDDNHCCVAFCVFLIMLVTLIVVPMDRNVVYENQILTSFNKLLLIGSEFSENTLAYQNTISIERLYDYLNKTLVKQFFPDNLNANAIISPMMFYHNVYIGPLRIRQLRTVNQTSCSKVSTSSQEIVCPFDVYSDETKDTKTFSTGTQSWQVYHTADENRISSTISGFNANYDGSGYVLDFDMTKTNYSVASATIKDLFDAGFIDFGTRAIFINANLYNPGLNQLVELRLGFELTTGGYVIPIDPGINLYRMTRYATEYYGVRYEIFQGIVAVLLLIFSIYMTATDENGKRHFNWMYWLTFPALANAVLIILVFLGINANTTIRAKGLAIKQLYESKQYFDAKVIVDLYSSSLLFESLGVFVAAIRLMYFLRLSPNFVLIINTISQAGRIFIQYILTLIPVLASFGVVGMLLWGTVSTDFNFRGNAFISVMALALGHFDATILQEADIYLTAVLLTLYYFFLIFFLITVFTSLTIDTYRAAKMDLNAQEGGKLEEFRLFAWLFSWLPTAQIKSASEKIQKWWQERKSKKDKDLGSPESLEKLTGHTTRAGENRM